MNSVERVKAICADRKIAISKLERDLGFSNGYIGQLRKGVFPADRLDKIANYLSVSTDYLLYGDSQKETPTLTAKDKRDIARDLEQIQDALENEDTIMFDGDPMSDEARDSIMNAIALGLQAAKLKNKEKYTPKKYRKG